MSEGLVFMEVLCREVLCCERSYVGSSCVIASDLCGEHLLISLSLNLHKDSSFCLGVI